MGAGTGGIVSLLRSTEQRCLQSLFVDLRSQRMERGRDSTRKAKSDGKKCLSQGFLIKKKKKSLRMKMPGNILMSLAGLGVPEFLTETPSRDCNVLAMCPI